MTSAAMVIVPLRSQDAIERLRAYLGANGGDRLTTLVGNLGEVDDAARLRDEIVGRFVSWRRPARPPARTSRKASSSSMAMETRS